MIGDNMMYVKKRVPVEAIQIPEQPTSENLSNWLKVAPNWLLNAYIDNGDGPELWITDAGIYVKTLEGDMLCPWGSYLIQGIRGEIYPCRRDIFEETYEPFYGITNVRIYDQKTGELIAGSDTGCLHTS